MTVNVSDDLVQRLAPDAELAQAARALVQKGQLARPGISADSSWLIGECVGSGPEPYHVSVDFSDSENPTVRCSCPSRKHPCKHGLALMFAYQENSGSFEPREPTEDLLIKREKKAALDEKKRTGAAVPRRVTRAAHDKKAAAQREGLDSLEKLLVELVSAGHWFDPAHLEKIDKLAKGLGDANLPASMFLLRRLALAAKSKEGTDEERMASSTDLLAQLWATVRLGKKYFDGPGAGGNEADLALEEVLGRPWSLADLRQRGYGRDNLHLLEIAYERLDDEGRQQRLEISDLLDLGSGEVYQAVAFRPFKGISPVPDQLSYTAPLKIAEAAVTPGFLNRRLLWERGAEVISDNSGRQLETAYGLAKTDLYAAVDAYRAMLANPLAPREAVVFVRSEQIGKLGKRVIIEAANGARIEAVDKRTDYSNAANLVRAAGMLGKDQPALLLRLYVRPGTRTIVALPLAAVTPKHHLRLGI